MIHAEAVSRAVDECDAVHGVDVVGDERLSGWMVTKRSRLLCKSGPEREKERIQRELKV